MTMIGDRIKQRRLQLGLKQQELADKLGYTSKSTIAKIETNVNDIAARTVTNFAKALDTTEAFLMGWTDNPELTHEEVIDNEVQNNISTTKIAYTSTPKEQELKDLIDKSGLPDEKIDLLLNMIESWV